MIGDLVLPPDSGEDGDRAPVQVSLQRWCVLDPREAACHVVASDVVRDMQSEVSRFDVRHDSL